MGKLRLSKVKGWCSVNAVPSWPPGMCAVGPITWATQDEADDLGTSWDKAGDEVRAVQPLGGGFSCCPPAWAGELGTKGLMSLGGREEEEDLGTSQEVAPLTHTGSSSFSRLPRVSQATAPRDPSGGVRGEGEVGSSAQRPSLGASLTCPAWGSLTRGTSRLPA